MKLAIPCLLLALGFMSGNRLSADEPKPRASALFTASDLARQAEHPLRLAAGGDFAIKVWSPANETWSLAVDGQTLTLTPKVEGNDTTPGWRIVGTAR